MDLQIGARNRNRTGTPFPARDFKSLVSTCFTIRACRYFKAAEKIKAPTALLEKLEAGVGIEPAYTALQAAA